MSSWLPAPYSPTCKPPGLLQTEPLPVTTTTLLLPELRPPTLAEALTTTPLLLMVSALPEP
jgi:hypothetical protein